MDETAQLSQGIFVERPKNNKRVKKKVLLAKRVDAFESPSETIPKRVAIFEEHMNRVENIVHDLEREWNDSVATQVGVFVAESIRAITSNQMVTPVGFLPVGLSTEENNSLFNEIEKEIRNHANFLARVNSSKCSNVKLAFQNICKQLMRKDLNVSEFHEMSGMEDLDDTVRSEETGPSSNRYQSVHDLQRWYEAQCPNFFDNPLVQNSPCLGASSLQRKQLRVRLFDINKEATGLDSENQSPQRKKSKLEEAETSEDSDCEFIDEITTKSDVCSLKNLKSRMKKEAADFQKEVMSRSKTKESVYDFDEDEPSQSHVTTPRGILKLSSSSSLKKVPKPSLSLNPSTPVTPFSPGKKTSTPKSVRLIDNPKFSTPKMDDYVGTPKSSARRSHCGLRKRLSLRSRNSSEVIVIILENSDFFPPNVIPQTLQLLSCSKLPVLFIFGVNQSLSHLHRFIPQSSSSTFVYKTFESTSSSQKLNTALELILADPEVPFKLSGRILSYLSEFFESQHFSVTRLLQVYKMCMIEHFRTPESVFCTNSLDEESFSGEFMYWKKTKDGRNNNSKRKFCAPKTKTDLKEAVLEIRTAMEDWLGVLYLLRALHVQVNMTMTTSNCSFNDLYISCATGEFFEGSEEGNGETMWTRVLKYLDAMKKQQMKETLISIHAVVKDHSEAHVGKQNGFLKEIQKFVKRFREVAADDSKSDAKQKAEAKLDEALKLQRMTRESLKTVLLETIRNENGPFLALRKSFVEFIERTITTYLKPFKEYRYNEIFVYDDLNKLKSMFSPVAQHSMVTSLSLPGKILNCDCCEETDERSIDENLPDTSILFKLLLEQTCKKIDLNPIYESFVACVEPQGPVDSHKRGKRKGDKTEDNSELNLIRFRQAVAELQHTGVLKRNKSKPDEITKLVW